MEHSKLPFTVQETDSCFYLCSGPKCLGQLDMYLSHPVIPKRISRAEAKANAEFVRTACNAHATLKAQAELLEELIAKIDNFEKQRKGNPQQCLLDFAWNEVIEAYTKAE